MSSPFKPALHRVAAAMLVPLLCLLAMPAMAAGSVHYNYLRGGSDQLFLPLDGARKIGDAQPVLVSREHLRAAAKSGELHARDRAGRRYVLQVEREQLERTGDTTLIARVDTVLGRQSAVITYGEHGVFGVLPQPDGKVMQFVTRHGETVLVEMGGMIPPGLDPSSAPDVVIPPRPEGAGDAPRLLPEPGTLVVPADVKATTLSASAARGASSKSTPSLVEIDLLAVYTRDLVEQVGSIAAAETEYTNHVATANQAFQDSGAVARLRVVGFQEITIDPVSTNHTALYAIQSNQLSDGFDLHARRNELGADLVALLRPYRDGHGSCGVGYLNGWGLNPHAAAPAFGFSVSNVAPCSPYVLAHEIGHNLGSHHDVDTVLASDAANDQLQSYGAYPYSYGYRQSGPPNFATIMAYPLAGQPRVGRFSNPRETGCMEAACGLDGQADNVRSINKLAARIARFRDVPGTLSVLDGSARENESGVAFLVRYSGAAPEGGVSGSAEVLSGSAARDVDIRIRSLSWNILPGESDAWFYVDLVDDDLVEGDETFTVRLTEVDRAPVHRAEAAGTVRDDDPKVRLSGRLLFPDGVIPSEEWISVGAYLMDDEGFVYEGLSTHEPDYAYSLDVPKGQSVWLEVGAPPEPLVRERFQVGVIEADRTFDIPLQRYPIVSGRLLFPPDLEVPQQPILVHIDPSHSTTGSGSGGFLTAAFPPDFEYRAQVRPNSRVNVSVWRPAAPLLSLRSTDIGVVEGDHHHDIQLEAGIAITGRVVFPEGVSPPNRPISLWVTPWDDVTDGNSLTVYPPDFRFATSAKPGRAMELRVEGQHPFSSARVDLGTPVADVETEVVLGTAPVLTIHDAVEAEGNNGNRAMRFRLTLSQPAPAEGFPVWLETAIGTADDGGDFVAVDNMGAANAFFAAGETEAFFEVTVVGDSNAEPDEYFVLRTWNSQGLAHPFAAGIGVLRDDDGSNALPQLWLPGMVQVLEGDGVSETSVSRIEPVRVRLSRPAPAGGVRFTARTEDGTADADDYFLAGATSPTESVIPEGSTDFVLRIGIAQDNLIEGDEYFDLKLENVVGAQVSSAAGSVWILNDDQNVPGQAVNDHYAVAKETSLEIPETIGVLANDTRPLRSVLWAEHLRRDGPHHGTLSLSGDGGFVYLPAPGFVGSDQFVYSLSWGGDYSYGKVALSVVEPLRSTDQYLWMLPPASNAEQQGFVRLINREDQSGTVSIWGIDATGRRSSGTLTATLSPRQSLQFNSQDLEGGNAAKGLSGAIGSGSGNWTLVVRSDLELDALGYLRTPDGFLTSLHDRVEGDGVDWFVPVFNPASNPNQVSWLRLINSTLAPVDVQISGVDDTGRAGNGVVTMTLPPLASREYSAIDLEQGNASKALTGQLGDGEGKWRLTVSATDRISVQSLLADPEGYLTNLSSFAPDTGGGEQTLWMVTRADNTQQQSFVRLTNLSSRSGTVTLWGIDDRGRRSAGTATTTLAAGQTRHFNSQDLENGNSSKGLSGSLGAGDGNWRLLLSTDLDLLPMGLVRTPNGFLTTTHDLVAESALRWRVPMFNPGRNTHQVSVLRLVNPGASTVNVSVAGVDDAGQASPEGSVSLQLAPHAAVEVTSQELEAGSAGRGLVGRLGAGDGKWLLNIEADQPLQVMSLLRDPQGYLTNLSNGTRGGSASLDP